MLQLNTVDGISHRHSHLGERERERERGGSEERYNQARFCGRVIGGEKDLSKIDAVVDCDTKG
jgi:hypothetical protein